MSERPLTFGDLGTLFDGPHATPTRTNEGPYFLSISSLKSGRLDLSESDHVSSQDFEQWTRRVTPQKNDLLFSYETRLGDAALMPDGVEACLGRRMALLRPNGVVVDPRFLLYYYLSPAFQQLIAQNTVQGATVSRIGLATMPNWRVHLPRLAVQRAIAAVLGALDDKIEANDRLRSTSHSLLQVSYERLGVDGGEFEGDDTLDQLIDVNPRTGSPGSGPAPYLDMKTLPDRTMTTAGTSHRVARGGARFINGDTLLARITPCLENGKLGYVDFLADGKTGVGSTEFIVLRPKVGTPSTFAYFLSASDRFRDYAIRHMAGTTGRQRLAASDVARYDLRRPASAELAGFGAVSDAVMPRVRAAVEESRQLAAARDELLPLLMSGKLRVKDAEKVVEEVV